MKYFSVIPSGFKLNAVDKSIIISSLCDFGIPNACGQVTNCGTKKV
jgi:hypothetical protein